MATHSEAAEQRIFYGWWVTVGFSIIIFLSTGIRGLLLVGAGLFLTLDVTGRPMRRVLQPVAGGR